MQKADSSSDGVQVYSEREMALYALNVTATDKSGRLRMQKAYSSSDGVQGYSEREKTLYAPNVTAFKSLSRRSPS